MFNGSLVLQEEPRRNPEGLRIKSAPEKHKVFLSCCVSHEEPGGPLELNAFKHFTCNVWRLREGGGGTIPPRRIP